MDAAYCEDALAKEPTEVVEALLEASGLRGTVTWYVQSDWLADNVPQDVIKRAYRKLLAIFTVLSDSERAAAGGIAEQLADDMDLLWRAIDDGNPRFFSVAHQNATDALEKRLAEDRNSST